MSTGQPSQCLWWNTNINFWNQALTANAWEITHIINDSSHHCKKCTGNSYKSTHSSAIFIFFPSLNCYFVLLGAVEIYDNLRFLIRRSTENSAWSCNYFLFFLKQCAFGSVTRSKINTKIRITHKVYALSMGLYLFVFSYGLHIQRY